MLAWVELIDLPYFCLPLQPTVCNMEDWSRQKIAWMHRYFFCHEFAFRTQGVHTYQVKTNFCCLCFYIKKNPRKLEPDTLTPFPLLNCQYSWLLSCQIISSLWQIPYLWWNVIDIYCNLRYCDYMYCAIDVLKCFLWMASLFCIA